MMLSLLVLAGLGLFIILNKSFFFQNFIVFDFSMSIVVSLTNYFFCNELLCSWCSLTHLIKNNNIFLLTNFILTQIVGLKEEPVSNFKETMSYLISGSDGRTTGATAMNTTSSRSHAIFTLHIEQRKKNDL